MLGENCLVKKLFIFMVVYLCLLFLLAFSPVELTSFISSLVMYLDFYKPTKLKVHPGILQDYSTCNCGINHRRQIYNLGAR
jgi:hypothetical protein